MTTKAKNKKFFVAIGINYDNDYGCGFGYTKAAAVDDAQNNVECHTIVRFLELTLPTPKQKETDIPTTKVIL